jgi:hypothetical protein
MRFNWQPLLTVDTLPHFFNDVPHIVPYTQSEYRVGTILDAAPPHVGIVVTEFCVADGPKKA